MDLCKHSLLPVLYIGCHQSVWPRFKVYFPTSGNLDLGWAFLLQIIQSRIIPTGISSLGTAAWVLVNSRCGQADNSHQRTAVSEGMSWAVTILLKLCDTGCFLFLQMLFCRVSVSILPASACHLLLLTQALWRKVTLLRTPSQPMQIQFLGNS